MIHKIVQNLVSRPDDVTVTCSGNGIAIQVADCDRAMFTSAILLSLSTVLRAINRSYHETVVLVQDAPVHTSR